MLNKNRLPVGAAGLGVLLLAGCAGSSPPASSAVSSPSASPATLAQLNKIVLQAADFPAGTKIKAYKFSPADPANDAAVAKCVGAPNTDLIKVAKANSASFTVDGVRMTSYAASFRSQGEIDSDIAMWNNPKFSRCLEQQMKTGFAPSFPAGTQTEASVKITPGAAGGPANVVATGAVTFKAGANGERLNLHMALAFITGPLIHAEVSADKLNAPITAAQMKPLVAAVAARAAKG